MVGCVSSQLKPSELDTLSCERSLGLRPQPFSQLRMLSSKGFILYRMSWSDGENNVLVCFKNFERQSTSHNKSLHSLTRAVSVLWTDCMDSRKLSKCSKAVTLPPDMGNPRPILGKGCPTSITRAVMQQDVCQTCLIIKRVCLIILCDGESRMLSLT